ncbi:MAG: LacI family transcriptional regulator [Opitutaceae bacterium]|nr:LacI family transcriptional regulator [Opitutaceae bacterium]
MSNQSAIARALGLNQATVSRALRNAPGIAAKTHRAVLEAAQKMGYTPNPMVVSLMNRIRDGRRVSDHGCIAILCAVTPPGPSANDTFGRQFLGMIRGAEARGFRPGFFSLDDYGMNLGKIDRVLKARGITGLILAPSGSPRGPVPLDWSRYACATLGTGWPDVPVDRSGINHRHQMDAAMGELLRRGYRRIGFCLPRNAVDGIDGAWMDRYLYWQYKVKNTQPFPLFVGTPATTPAADFRHWLRKWKPDAILGLIGHELEWLDALGLRAPDDIGLACLNHQTGSPVSGMDEQHEAVGKIAAETVINRILHNEFGLPEHPRLILIDGIWCEGKTLRCSSAA